jgi:predicted transglutaminase-like cysteine proteinase
MPKAVAAFSTSLFVMMLTCAAFAADAPAAFYDFCARNPAECSASGPFVGAITLTPERKAQLQAVNRKVNSTIRELPEAVDVWSIPTTEGDCEDFAILKRHMLIKMGWPSSVLLLTVVRRPNNDGHAVLTVVTDKGDLILGLPSAEIVTPQTSRLRFFTRQSQRDPRAWEETPYK